MATFLPQENNIGGRQQISELFFNHIMTLIQSRPEIRSFNQKENYKEILRKKKSINYDFIRESRVKYRKNSVKRGSIDTSEPKTLQLKLSPMNKRKEEYISQEHYSNLLNQKRKINSLRRMSERKKNFHDPFAYPSLFFRRKTENKSPFPNSFPNPSNLPFQGKGPYFEKKKVLDKPKKYLRNPENSKKIETENVPCIIFKGTEMNDIKMEIKKQALKIIFTNKLYSREDISSVYRKFCKKNSHLKKDLIKGVFEEIFTDLKNLSKKEK